MFDDRSWYLVVRDMDHDGGLVGFSHFRFDMDNNQEVCFIYTTHEKSTFYICPMIVNRWCLSMKFSWRNQSGGKAWANS